MAAAANIKIMKTYVALPSLFLSLKTCKDNFYFENTTILLQQQNMYIFTYLVNIQHSMRIIRLDGMTMTFLKKGRHLP